MQALFFSFLSAQLVCATPLQDVPKSADKEVVGYVADVSNPGQIVLTGDVAVAVNDKTKYWLQAGKEKPKKASIDAVRVGRQIRAILGKDGIATKVTIVQGS